MKKRILFLSSFALLAGCGMNQADEAEVEVEAETEIETTSEETEEVVHTENSHPLENMINETTFVDTYALQAWEDYQAVASDVSYGDISYLNSEEPDIASLEGTSRAEVDALFSALDLREDVFTDGLEVTDSEEMHFYRYPAEAQSEYSEISDFLAELSFYYVDDNLIFSSITPGLYEFSLDGLQNAEDLTTLTHISEIEALDPHVLTIAEMNMNEKVIQQLMIPSISINEEGNEEVTAFYFFIHGEDIIYYAFLPFETVRQSFPDYSLLLYGQMLPEIAEVAF